MAHTPRRQMRSLVDSVARLPSRHGQRKMGRSVISYGSGSARVGDDASKRCPCGGLHPKFTSDPALPEPPNADLFTRNSFQVESDLTRHTQATCHQFWEVDRGIQATMEEPVCSRAANPLMKNSGLERWMGTKADRHASSKVSRQKFPSHGSHPWTHRRRCDSRLSGKSPVTHCCGKFPPREDRGAQRHAVLLVESG